MKTKIQTSTEFVNAVYLQPTRQRMSLGFNNMQPPTTTPEQAKQMPILSLVNYSRMFSKYDLDHTEQARNINREIYRRVMGTDKGAK